MILLRQREFTSKSTKKLRRKILLDAADNSFEKDEANRLLKAGKIDEREWNRRVIKKGKERLGIDKPILSDGGHTINLENIPNRSAGEVNSNFSGKYATKGKSRLERGALKAQTRRQLEEYKQGGLFGSFNTGYNIEELVDDATKSGKINSKEARRILNLKEAGEQAQADALRKLEKKEELLKKAVKVEKAVKKAAPYALAGTAVLGATAAGIKIAKKKKAKKEDK